MTLANLQPLTLPQAAPARVLACGAWLKNTACLLDAHQAWVSPVHGDLSDPDSRQALLESVAFLQRHASGPIEAVAHDLHPDFFSTQVACQVAQALGVPAIGVQHHHAHVALLQAQHPSADPLIGLALDGVGYGLDGTSWGGELLCLRGPHMDRLAHLPTLLLPGADAAAREPWRMAAALLQRLGLSDELPVWLERSARMHYLVSPGTGMQLGGAHARHLQTLMDKSVNCPSTSAAGRWFDAVAGLLGVCLRQTEEAQAAMALEALAQTWLDQHGAPEVDVELRAAGLDLRVLMQRILALCEHAPVDADTVRQLQAECAALFHVTLATVLADAAVQVAHDLGSAQVALSGGCFFNRILRTHISQRIELSGLKVLQPCHHAFGDAGLSLGQAWVAALQVQELRYADIEQGELTCV